MMKKKLFTFTTVALVIVALAGCSSNQKVTQFGGTKKIELPENMKFVNYNIQSESDIWCTYRPMRDDEQPETFVVSQHTSELNFYGGGQFVIYETKDGVKSSDID